MNKLDKLVRKNIRDLQAYSSARSESQLKEGTFLDANESPFGVLNRYPDPLQIKLKQKLAAAKNVNVQNVFVGNGSDEVIDLAFRIFCNPESDKALLFTPTYGMYQVCADINNVQTIKVPLTDQFQIDKEALGPFLSDRSVKMIFICSPNNPTGNLMKRMDIEHILSSFNGIVVIDEAYIDFAPSDSCLDLIKKYDNLIISQTFSKAFGLAGIRVGVAYSNPKIIDYYNKIKPPYNVSELNQSAALDALNKMETMKNNVEVLLKERNRVEEELKAMVGITQIHPSDANFLLVEFTDASEMYEFLINQQVIVRNRSTLVANCLRITIGSPEENDILLKAIKMYCEKSTVY